MSSRRPLERMRCTLAVAVGLLAFASFARAADPWQDVRDRADSLAATGDFEAAWQLVHRATVLVCNPSAPGWRCREHRMLERYYADAAHVRKPAERESLAVATAELRAAQGAMRREAIAEAERRAEHALAIREDILGEGHWATADAQMTLAQTTFVLARVHDVDSLAREAGRTYGRAFGEDHPRFADAEELLGRNLKNFTGRIARPQVMEHYDRALRIRTAALGAWSPEVGECFHDIGNMERLAGNRAEALAAFRRALEIRRRSEGVRSHGAASTLGAMAMLEAERANWTAAESLCTAAVSSAPDDVSPRARAFRTGLLGQILRQQGRAAAATPWLRRAIAIQESLWTGMPRDEGSVVFSGFSLYFDLALVLAAQDQPLAAFQALEQGTSRTLVEHELAQGGSPASAVTLEEIQRAIPADAALVHWIEARFGNGLRGETWACIVRSQGPPHWVRLPNSNKVFSGRHPLNFAYWQELRAAARWPWRIAAEPRGARLASEVGRIWFTPLERHLEGVRHIVVFSPDLCGGGPLSALSDSSGRPIGDRFSISYVPSATWYTLAARSRHASPRTGSTLVVADPAFRAAKEGGWLPLAGSRDEIASARAALGDVHVLQGEQASARALRDLARRGELARFRVLHFSTHTAADGVAVMGSSLVLAPNRPGEPESHITAREISETWRLDADLVCLTGCEATSGMRAASQGFLGLQQALLRAGARSVLVSTWPVEDRATALLMREFYSRLVRGSGAEERARALQEAQRAVRLFRAPDGSQPYAHPVYWAGFTLIGGPG